MKFVVSSTSLSARLQAVSKVITPKNEMPIRGNILFQVEGKRLTLTASDDNNTVKAELEIESGDGDFAFTVPAPYLLEIMGKFPEIPLTFDVGDLNKIQLTSENGKYQLVGTPADEYPQMKAMNAPSTFTMPPETLFRAISKTVFATAESDLRPIMSGICFSLNGEKLECGTTDSQQLVRYINTGTKGEEATFVLPRKPAGILKDILSKEKDDVKITFDENSACFALSSYTLICRLLEGKYPNLNSVIPNEAPNKLTVDTESFISAINRVAVCSDSATHLIKLDLKPTEMTISAQDYDHLTFATETIACLYEGEPAPLGLKAPLLLRMLSAIDAPEVILAMGGGARAVLISPSENKENEDLLMLLMPMSLGEN